MKKLVRYMVLAFTVTNCAARDSSGFYDLIDRAIAPFKSGYSYSEEEKARAYAEIIRLEQEKVNILEQCKKDINDTGSAYQRALVTNECQNKIADVDNKIYQQKVITGEVMSTKRKLLWGGLALGAALVGGVTVYKYFTKIQPLEKLELSDWDIYSIKTGDFFPVRSLFSYITPSPARDEMSQGALEKRLWDIIKQKFVSGEEANMILKKGTGLDFNFPKDDILLNPAYNRQDEDEARELFEYKKKIYRF
jgi:hypothetical protein